MGAQARAVGVMARKGLASVRATKDNPVSSEDEFGEIIAEDMLCIGQLAGTIGIPSSRGEDYLPNVREHLMRRYGFTEGDLRWATNCFRARRPSMVRRALEESINRNGSN
ncbi:MAG: hypothetical protein CO184_01095 [Candidatus Zambryskibacteria bacterium CG_4_9_14_3_um_filter_40_16]|uniref:Uncharacterized protein n=1 Tax=Candidatus Zambryskibacteria bacterium CG_4_9_14_3_um_filter_40_16 TaxID=1975111 RepID=A0A2M7WUM0_9BACT|nr:MAG: hypothetical protein CO184_01095 [Candidatus Zambryskibacteria bacterium CG_4_9_14_3_um_filter_40_16]